MEIKKKCKYTKELLEPIVKSSQSWREVLCKLGLKISGGSHRHIQGKIRFYNLNVDHFVGYGWSKGKTVKDHPGICQMANKKRIPNDKVFIENSPINQGPKLTKRLIALGWKYICQKCGIDEWKGQLLRLHLDHINGVNNDNRFENLRFLCPNCHQQTETWGYSKRTHERKI